MTAIDPWALAMAVFGFVFLFGGLAVTLWIALQSGGYSDDESVDGDDKTGESDE